MNHPVDVQKKNTSTVDVTSQNLQDVELGDDNALLFDDGLSEKNLAPQTTPVEPVKTLDPLEIVGDVITTVCQVAKEANASEPETEINPPKKCACGSTTHLRRNHRDCPLNPKSLEKRKDSSVNASN